MMTNDWSNLIWFICDGDKHGHADVIAERAKEMREFYTVADMEALREATDRHEREEA